MMNGQGVPRREVLGTLHFFKYFLFGVLLHSMWDLSFPTHAPSSGSVESEPLECQGSPSEHYILNPVLPVTSCINVGKAVDNYQELYKKCMVQLIFSIEMKKQI